MIIPVEKQKEIMVQKVGWFQFMLPCSEQVYNWLSNLLRFDFNSLSPCGEHTIDAATAEKLRVSIHAPVWGVLVSAVELIGYLIISIHAPRVGSIPDYYEGVNQGYFQFMLPVWGAQ